MKILAFTDIHGSLHAINRIEQKTRTQKLDLLVCAGDISIFESGITGIFRRLNKMNKEILIVHGNHEDEKTFIKASKTFKNVNFIHKKHFIKDDVLFLGYGGGGFSIVDRDFERVSHTFKKIIKENSAKKIILVTHAPPYKTKLDKLVEGHCGNKSIRHFIEKNRIDYLICGHLHENFGKEDKIHGAKIINPGPLGKIIVV